MRELSNVQYRAKDSHSNFGHLNDMEVSKILGSEWNVGPNWYGIFGTDDDTNIRELEQV